jgi:hypothetical protein
VPSKGKKYLKKKKLAIGFKAQPDNPGWTFHLKIPNLIIWEDIFFQSEVPWIWCEYFWEVIFSL